MKRSVWAVAALVMGAISFIQLAGIEKAIAAIVFGVLALKEIRSAKGLHGVWFARVAIVLGAIYIVLAVVLLAIFLPQILAYAQGV